MITANPPINFIRNRWTGKYEGLLEFDIMNNNINEPNGRISVTLNNEATPTTYFVGSPASASVAITDDDPVPTILIANTNVGVNENASMISIPVQLSNPTTEAVEIAWSTSANTASLSDFETKSQTLEIEGSVIGFIQIPITDDDFYEGNETFTITLNEPSQATFLNSLRDPNDTSQVKINVTIRDNEVIPTVSFSDRNITVLEGSASANLELNLSGKSTSDVMVNYLTTAGTATAGSDFIAIPASPARTATISADHLTTTIQVQILNDEIDESNETLTVTLSNPQNAILPNSIADASITITITDQDIPELSIANGTMVTESAECDRRFHHYCRYYASKRFNALLFTCKFLISSNWHFN